MVYPRYYDKVHGLFITHYHYMERFVPRNSNAYPRLDIHLDFDVYHHDWILLGYYRIVAFLKKLIGFKEKTSPIRPLHERRHKPPSACTYALSAQAMRWMR